MQTEKYPLDFNLLKKGDVIPVEALERITNTNHGSDAYKLKVLNLAAQIERELGARGTKCTVTTPRGMIRILTDREAVIHTARQYRSAGRRARKNYMRLLQVDDRNLSEDERKTADSQRLRMGTELAAARKARRKLTVECHKRQTPGLPGPN